jgi:hypothetical protein
MIRKKGVTVTPFLEFQIRMKKKNRKGAEGE